MSNDERTVTCSEPLPEQTENGLHEGDEFISPEELETLIMEVVEHE